MSEAKLLYAKCYSVEDYRDGSQLVKLSTELEDNSSESEIAPGCIALAFEEGDSMIDYFIPGSIYTIDINIASFISCGDA